MIKIGIFLNTNYGADENVAARFRETAEQVRMARDYGFSSVCVGQHFLTEYQKLHPVPVLSRLAAESGDMRLLPGASCSCRSSIPSTSPKSSPRSTW